YCLCSRHLSVFFLVLNIPSPTVISSLSLHDALPICTRRRTASSRSRSIRCWRCRADRAYWRWMRWPSRARSTAKIAAPDYIHGRSEEHTSELQSRENLVCRLLLEKKK